MFLKEFKTNQIKYISILLLIIIGHLLTTFIINTIRIIRYLLTWLVLTSYRTLRKKEFRTVPSCGFPIYIFQYLRVLSKGLRHRWWFCCSYMFKRNFVRQGWLSEFKMGWFYQPTLRGARIVMMTTVGVHVTWTFVQSLLFFFFFWTVQRRKSKMSPGNGRSDWCSSLTTMPLEKKKVTSGTYSIVKGSLAHHFSIWPTWYVFLQVSKIFWNIVIVFLFRVHRRC